MWISQWKCLTFIYFIMSQMSVCTVLIQYSFRLLHIIKHFGCFRIRKYFSYLTEDAAYVLATGEITWVVKVCHNGVKLDSYLPIFLQITASKLWILLAESQWLPGSKRWLVVQTLGMTASPPGLEEQQQEGQKNMVEGSMLQVVMGYQSAGLKDHIAKMLPFSLEQFATLYNIVVSRSSL